MSRRLIAAVLFGLACLAAVVGVLTIGANQAFACPIGDPSCEP